jgi:hypothetical protein
VATQRIEADDGGRPVLVKSAAAGPEADRLRDEAATLRLAAHPGVVQLIGLDEDDDGGVGLRLAVAGTRTFADLRTDLVAAARALAGLATTVADLHDLGLVHGRITADHVVLDGAGRAVLCGFADAGPRGELDPATDVHGLGLLLGSILSRAGAGADTGGEWEPIPDRRFGRGDRWLGFVRRALLTLADHATDDDPARRPTARGFAASVLASLPSTGVGRRSPAGPDLVAGVARLQRGLDGLVAAVGGRSSAPARLAPDEPLDAVAMLGGAEEPSSERSVGAILARVGRSATPLAAALGLGLLVFGIGALLRPAPGPSTSLAAPGSSTTGPAAVAPSTTTTATTTVTAATAGPVGPGCEAAAAPAADPDGDGCPSTVLIGDAVVEVDGVRYGVGRPGDLLAVADWDCDGLATVALVHRGSGEVFLFDGWATGGAEASATSLGTVPGAEAVEAVDAGAGVDGCRRLVVIDADGDRTEVPA